VRCERRTGGGRGSGRGSLHALQRGGLRVLVRHGGDERVAEARARLLDVLRLANHGDDRARALVVPDPRAHAVLRLRGGVRGA
jgi:hypothetical protein